MRREGERGESVRERRELRDVKKGPTTTTTTTTTTTCPTSAAAAIIFKFSLKKKYFLSLSVFPSPS